MALYALRVLAIGAAYTGFDARTSAALRCEAGQILAIILDVMAGQGRAFAPDSPGHPRLHAKEDVDTW